MINKQKQPLFTYHRQLDFSRIGMIIEEGRNDHNTRSSKRFEALISTNRIELERVIGKDDKATERDGHWEHFSDGYSSNVEYAELIAGEKSQECDHEIEACERHVWKVELFVDVLVHLDNRYRRDQIERKAQYDVQLLSSSLSIFHLFQSSVYNSKRRTITTKNLII